MWKTERVVYLKFRDTDLKVRTTIIDEPASTRLEKRVICKCHNVLDRSTTSTDGFVVFCFSADEKCSLEAKKKQVTVDDRSLVILHKTAV